jgi:hypothetical protein
LLQNRSGLPVGLYRSEIRERYSRDEHIKVRDSKFSSTWVLASGQPVRPEQIRGDRCLQRLTDSYRLQSKGNRLHRPPFNGRNMAFGNSLTRMDRFGVVSGTPVFRPLSVLRMRFAARERPSRDGLDLAYDRPVLLLMTVQDPASSA